MKTVKLNYVKISIFCYCLLLNITIYAQQKDVILTNSQAVENNLYEGIEGSPFYFDHWQKGKIYSKSDKDPIEEVLLNYNGYTQSFEIKKGNQYITLDEKWYKKVVMEETDQTLLTFKTGLLPNKAEQFVKLVYAGSDFCMVEDYYVSLVKREKQQYGKVETVETFAARPAYYFVQNGKSQLIKLKKKNILGLFTTHQSKIEQFVKTHRLKLDSEAEVVKVLAYYDALIRPSELTHTGEKQ